MEGLKKSFLVRGNNIVGFSDKNFSTAPIGTVLSFAGQIAPNGYLLCNGASYAVADYPDLYAVIGNTYGGDSTNFNVPNLIDKFIQGSTTSGTEKEAGLPNITGGWMPSVPVNYQNYANGAVAAEIKSSGLVSSSGTQAAIGAGFKIDASKSSAVYGKSTTVQPPALTMVYIIKAFHTNEGVDSGVSDDVIEYVDNKISSNLGEKVDYKAVVEDGTRYVEDVVTQDINTWLPNDNSSILINLKKSNGISYLNFQLLCNKKDSKNWSCIVNGASNELWKIRYIDGVRYIDELVTMGKLNFTHLGTITEVNVGSHKTLDILVDWKEIYVEARMSDQYTFTTTVPKASIGRSILFGCSIGYAEVNVIDNKIYGYGGMYNNTNTSVTYDVWYR